MKTPAPLEDRKAVLHRWDNMVPAASGFWNKSLPASLAGLKLLSQELTLVALSPAQIFISSEIPSAT